MNTPLSSFDQGILDTFIEGVMAEMPDTITILGVTIQACVMDRSTNQVNIQGGKENAVNATVEVRRVDYLATGALIASNLTPAGGSTGPVVTFSDGIKGRISSVDDFAGPILTLHIGSTLAGATGPSGGKW